MLRRAHGGLRLLQRVAVRAQGVRCPQMRLGEPRQPSDDASDGALEAMLRRARPARAEGADTDCEPALQVACLVGQPAQLTRREQHLGRVARRYDEVAPAAHPRLPASLICCSTWA